METLEFFSHDYSLPTNLSHITLLTTRKPITKLKLFLGSILSSFSGLFYSYPHHSSFLKLINDCGKPSSSSYIIHLRYYNYNMSYIYSFSFKSTFGDAMFISSFLICCLIASLLFRVINSDFRCPSEFTFLK